MQLTDISIKALKPPAEGQKTFFDDSLSGFGVRISQGGTKTFVLMHGRSRRLTSIGRVGIVTLKNARQKAKQVLAERILGKKDLPNITFEKALTTFLGEHERKVKPSTYRTGKRLLEKFFLPKFRYEKLYAISSQDITDILDKLMDVPGEQRHAFASIRLFMRWVTRRGYLDRSPMELMQTPSKAKSRTRVLSDDELKAVLKVCASPHPEEVSERFAAIVYMLLLTGQRVNQIASLRGEWIDRNIKTITFPATVMKGNREHIIPYGDAVADLIKELPEQGFMFPARGRNSKFNGFSKCKADFDTACGVKDWTLHDLRRTLRTNLAILKVPREIGERILDHRSAAATDVELIYDRHLYLDEMRDAFKLWEGKVRSLCSLG
jgi:integrase